MTDMIKCCFCDTEEEYGNNPEPFVVEQGERCCNFCNEYWVIPARIRVIKHEMKNPRKPGYGVFHQEHVEPGYGAVEVSNLAGVLEKTYYYRWGNWSSDEITAFTAAHKKEKKEVAHRQRMREQAQSDRERFEKLQEERKVRDEEECKQRAADFERRISALEVKEAQRKEEEKREKEEKARKAEAKREQTLKKQEAKQAKWQKQ